MECYIVNIPFVVSKEEMDTIKEAYIEYESGTDTPDSFSYFASCEIENLICSKKKNLKSHLVIGKTIVTNTIAESLESYESLMTWERML